MLRNRTERVPGGPNAGMLIAGTNYVGLLGSDILAAAGSGDFGASIFSVDSIDPAKRYRAALTSSTFPAGTLDLYENGSGEFVPPGGIATLSLYEDNLLYGSKSLTGGIGAVVTFTFVEPADDTAAIGGFLAHGAALAFIEPADDAIAVGGTIIPIRTGALAFTEPQDDTAAIAGSFSRSASFAFTEVGDDTPAIGGTVTGIRSAAFAFAEVGDDTVSVSATVTPLGQVSASLSFAEPADDTVAVGGVVLGVRSASLAFVEPADDVAAVRGTVLSLRGSLAFVEVGDDVFAAQGVHTIPQSFAASLAFVEPADDSAEVSGIVVRGYLASLAFVEPADDTFAATAGYIPAIPATFMFIEPEDDLFAARGTVIMGAASLGTLARLAQDFCNLRLQSALFLTYDAVLRCAIDAARFYAGWQDLEDPTADSGPFSIVGETRVTSDEWAIIAPLFRLYVERETAVVIEASRGQGVEQLGRTYSEVESDIRGVEADLAQRAYQEDAWTVGIDPPA